MKFIAFFVLLYLVSSSEGQTTISSESTTTSLNCPAPKQLFHDEDGFAVQLNRDVVHIYKPQHNSYLVLNPELTAFAVIDGINNLLFACEADSGFSGMFNPKTDILYIVQKNLKLFDLSKALQGNFTIAESLIDYALKYTDKVVGSGIDATQLHYANTTILLQDYAATTDYTKWVYYQGGLDGKKSYWHSEIKAIELLNKLFNSDAGYKADWGAVMFYVAIAEQYKKEEECESAFTDVMMKIIKDYNVDFDSTLMEKLYEIVSTQEHMTKEEAIQKYEALLEDKYNLSELVMK